MNEFGTAHARLAPFAVSLAVPQLATCYGSVTRPERICRGPGVLARAGPARASLDHHRREGTLMRGTTSNAVRAALAELTVTASSSGSASMAAAAPASLSSASQTDRSLAQAEEMLVTGAAARPGGTACRLNRLSDPRPPREDDRCRRRWPAGSLLSELALDASLQPHARHSRSRFQHMAGRSARLTAAGRPHQGEGDKDK